MNAHPTLHETFAEFNHAAKYRRKMTRRQVVAAMLFTAICGLVWTVI